MSDDASPNEDEASEIEPRSTATSSHSFVSSDNQSTSFQTFIPTLRTSTVIKKTSSRSLNSEKSMVNGSKESITSTHISHDKGNSSKEASVEIKEQQKTPPLISFSPSPDDKTISAVNVLATSKPSLIPTLSENIKSASRPNSKVSSVSKVVSSQNSGSNDEPATSIGVSDESKTSLKSSNPTEEVEKEAEQPRRGTVAKLERQLAELRIMAATSGQAGTRSGTESGIPKSTNMIKKSSVETFKKPGTLKSERADISNEPIAEKKVRVILSDDSRDVDFVSTHLLGSCFEFTDKKANFNSRAIARHNCRTCTQEPN
ncbi:hypothetical protein VKS41_000389 [Umbelopsis sp. WA50703]